MNKKIETFAKPLYCKRDVMHDFAHIKRILRIANNMAKNYDVDSFVISCGACFHGIIHTHEKLIKNFLELQNIPQNQIKKILRVSQESQKDSAPKTIEGKILHDAHLLEGGKTYIITKSLITGAVKGENLKQIITYMERNIFGKYGCCLPEAKKLYKQKEKFAKDFIGNLKKNI